MQIVAQLVTYGSFIGLVIWVPLCVKYLPNFIETYAGRHRHA